MRWFLCSKIHNATVTEANPSYVGSITIDKTLLKKAGLAAGEKVLVCSNTTGERLETYVIEGKKDSGIVCMNGPAARVIKKGEKIVIMGFELAAKPIKPKIILVDEKNNFVRFLKNKRSF